MWPKGAPYVMATNPTWINRDRLKQPLTLADILIIAPYHAQVFELQARLPDARVETINKF
jgi:hypothetical protein